MARYRFTVRETSFRTGNNANTGSTAYGGGGRARPGTFRAAAAVTEDRSSSFLRATEASSSTTFCRAHSCKVRADEDIAPAAAAAATASPPRKAVVVRAVSTPAPSSASTSGGASPNRAKDKEGKTEETQDQQVEPQSSSKSPSPSHSPPLPPPRPPRLVKRVSAVAVESSSPPLPPPPPLCSTHSQPPPSAAEPHPNQRNRLKSLSHSSVEKAMERASLGASRSSSSSEVGSSSGGGGAAGDESNGRRGKRKESECDRVLEVSSDNHVQKENVRCVAGGVVVRPHAADERRAAAAAAAVKLLESQGLCQETFL